MILTISSFEQLDGERLMALYRESNTENIEYFFPDAEDRGQALRQVEQGFLDYLQNDFFRRPGNAYWVLEEDGLWLSAVRLCPIREGLYYLEALETHPAHRREGCATRLLQGLFDELKARGPFRLCDCVSQKNLASLRTHERCGFRIVGEPGFDYLQNEPDEGSFGLEYRWPADSPA